MDKDTLERLRARASQHFLDSIAVKQEAEKILPEQIARGIVAMTDCLRTGGKVMACGNGGSAADAQHFAAELIGRFERERQELAAIALTTDTSILTAVGNDYGFDQIFSRQIMALGQPGDILVAISTSGNSTNVQLAIQAAHERDMQVIALTGRGGGTIGDMLLPDDIHLCVPHDRTMRIQEVHILLLHMLCDGIDALLLGDSA